MTRNELREFFTNLNIDIETKTDSGTTMLMTAVSGDLAALEIFLLIFGAMSDSEFKKMPLVHSDVLDVVNALLECGADVNARDNEGWTVLMSAVMVNPSPRCPEIVKILLDTGADVNAKDNDGTTALMFAAGDSTLEAVNVLLDAGADIHARNDAGKRAIDYALENEALQGTDALKRLEIVSENSVPQ